MLALFVLTSLYQTKSLWISFVEIIVRPSRSYRVTVFFVRDCHISNHGIYSLQHRSRTPALLYADTVSIQQQCLQRQLKIVCLIPSSTVFKMPSSCNTGTMASKKPRCALEACKKPVQLSVGECSYCKKCYCGDHRNLETHSCSGLDTAKQEARSRNEEKVRSEATKPRKGLEGTT